MQPLAHDITLHRAYYDARWAAEAYASPLDLARAVIVLDCLRRLNLRSPRILDLGCGTGWLTGMLAPFGPCTGLDLSPVAIQSARTRYPGVDFRVVDFSSTNSVGQGFDVVVSQEVIEHTADQRHYLSLAALALNPNGHLILTTPNAWNLAHWPSEAFRNTDLQPVERWLARTELRMLVEPWFIVRQLRTFMTGHGNTGVFRVAHSSKLQHALQTLHLQPLYQRLLEHAGFGLHIALVAQRRRSLPDLAPAESPLRDSSRSRDTQNDERGTHS